MTSTPPPPPPADPGAMDGFFDSLRRMNLPRRQERWIGGVASGIGARLGIDPLIVRGVFLVITLFGGLGLLIYGLAWALLPEAADGRIHLQEAIRGRFDAALVGATVFTVIGLSRVGFWWDGWFGIPYMIGMVALVALVIVVVAAVRSSNKSPSSTAQPGQSGSVPFTAGSGTVAGAQGAPDQQPAPDQAAAGPWTEGPWTEDPPTSGGEPHTDVPSGADQATPPGVAADDATVAHAPDESPTETWPPAGPATAAHSTDATTAYAGATGASHADQGAWSARHGTWPADQGAWTAAQGGAPPTTPPPTRPAQPPRPPKPTRPGPGRMLVRLTFGLALLAIAGLVYAGDYYDWSTSPWLVAFGGALVVLGLGATIAGLLGRRSASLGVVGTVLAIVMVPWAISAHVFTGYDFVSSSSYGERYWAPTTATEAAEGYGLAAGSIEVDLSRLVDETVTTPIDIDLAAGEVVLLVPDEMPVTVTASVQGEATAVNLSDWTAEVNDERRRLADRTDLGWRFGTRPMVAELTSPEAAEADDPLEVNIDVAFGAIEVRELP